MDISLLGLAKSVVPKAPLIIKTAVLSIFGLSPNFNFQDFLTELIVVTAQPVLGTPAALLKSQVFFNTDWNAAWGVWGRMWVSKYTIPKPDSDATEITGNLGEVGILEALCRAIEELGDGEQTYSMPGLADVETEWTGYRKGVSYIAGRPNLSEQEHYARLMDEVCPHSPTILYFHGGAFCLMDPATHRLATSALAKETRGRCLAVRYRLSPQNTFPSALLDGFISYLSLLSPPPGAFHSAVSPNQIVVSGDSSGGCLATSLVLFLRTLNRLGISHVRFHGRAVPISSTPVAGLAIASPWLDISRSLPSVYRNTRFDIIAPPTPDPSIHGATPNFPPDSIWPSQPPRVETYCEANMVMHPLVSPLAAREEHWCGSPPVYVNVGWEGFQDETEVFARRVYSAGVPVVFDGFAGMPHCFAIFPWNRAGRIAFRNWAQFCCRVMATGDFEQRNWGTWTDKNGLVSKVDMKELGMQTQGGRITRTKDLDDVTVKTLMLEQRDWRVQLQMDMSKRWELKHHSKDIFDWKAMIAWMLSSILDFLYTHMGWKMKFN